MTANLRARADIVDSLGSSLRSGGEAFTSAPALLRRLLEEDAWREFVTLRGEHVEHARFSDFVRTPPLKGLGADMDLVERIVGTHDPDLLVLLRAAEKVGHGPGRGHKTSEESTPLLGKGQDTGLTAQRLEREHPDEYERVKSGELSINAAAVLAGIRPRRFSIRSDDPGSIAKSLRRNLSPEALAALRDLLVDDP